MLKTISAALLAASVLVAPALAAQSTKTPANTPVINTTQSKTAVKTSDAKAIRGKTAALNANAEMGKHHRKHLSYHHRHHSKMGALKTRPAAQAKSTFKTAPKVSLKPTTSTTKRG